MEQVFDYTTIDNLKSLLNEESGDKQRDLADLDLSRSVRSGFGWDKTIKDFWGPIKPQMTINALMAWEDKVQASYSSAPFTFGISSTGRDVLQIEKVFSENLARVNVAGILGEVLRDTIDDGYAYACYATEIEDAERGVVRPVLRGVDARQVIHADCEDPTLKDCRIAAVVDTIKKDRVGKMFPGIDESDLLGPDPLNGYDVLNPDCSKYYSVVTVYEMVDDGVRVSKVVHSAIVSQVTISGMTRLPIARNVGRKVEIDKRTHYRGAYHFVADLLKSLNLVASQIQANVALAEDANWIADIRTLAGNLNDWANADVSGSVRGVNLGDTGDKLPMPIQTNKSPFTAELISTYDLFRRELASILGDVAAEAPKNATAEEILSRNESAAASRNMYIGNLQRFAEALGQINLELSIITTDVQRMLATGEMVGPLAYGSGSVADGIRVEIKDGPIVKDRRQSNVATLMAFSKVAVATQTPNVGVAVMPEILQNIDIDEQQKIRIAQKMFAGGQQLPPQITQQIQQLQNLVNEQRQYIANLENMLQTEIYRTQASLQMNREDNLVELQKTAMQNKTKENLSTQNIIAKAQLEADKGERDMQQSLVDLQSREPLVLSGSGLESRMGRRF